MSRPHQHRGFARATRPLLISALMVLFAGFSLFIRREVLISGFFADDYAQLAMVDGTYPVPRAPYDLFTFSNGTRAEGERLMRSGFYPWWADPTVRVSMFRPLASLLTTLDFKLFGNHALAYHIHSACWWLALLLMVGFLYRRWLDTPRALLAFALYVCDEAHGIALGWICSRAALASTLLSLISLWFYTQFRSTRRRRALAAAMLCYAVALGFGEYALCALGYFIAYEWFRASDPLLQRARAISPLLGVAFCYVGVRALGGWSAQRSGLYFDALSEPLAFIAATSVRLPVLVGDMLFALSADHWTWGFPYLYRAVENGWLSPRWIQDLEPWRTAQTVVGVVALATLAWIARIIARRRQMNQVLWLLGGALLALIPVCGSFPSSRLTIVAAVGFMPCLAELCIGALQNLRAKGQWRGRDALAAGAATVLAVHHVLLPTSFARDEALRIRELTRRVHGSIMQLDVDDRAFPRQDLVLLTAPEVGTSMYLPLTRRRYGRSAPHACWYLSLTAAPYELSRTAPNAFTIRFRGAATALQTPHEQILRSPHQAFRVGDTVELGLLRVTILELLEHRPKLISFEFDRPLDDPSLLFMVPTTRGYQRYPLPDVGGSSLVDMPVLPDPPTDRSR
jgi:hypothetical protein